MGKQPTDFFKTISSEYKVFMKEQLTHTKRKIYNDSQNIEFYKAIYDLTEYTDRYYFNDEECDFLDTLANSFDNNNYEYNEEFLIEELYMFYTNLNKSYEFSCFRTGEDIHNFIRFYIKNNTKSNIK